MGFSKNFSDINYNLLHNSPFFLAVGLYRLTSEDREPRKKIREINLWALSISGAGRALISCDWGKFLLGEFLFSGENFYFGNRGRGGSGITLRSV